MFEVLTPEQAEQARADLLADLKLKKLQARAAARHRRDTDPLQLVTFGRLKGTGPRRTRAVPYVAGVGLVFRGEEVTEVLVRAIVDPQRRDRIVGAHFLDGVSVVTEPVETAGYWEDEDA